MLFKEMVALCFGVALTLSGCSERERDNDGVKSQSSATVDPKAGIRSAIVARNFGEAVRLAIELTTSSPADAEAWLLLARAEALSDNEGAALDALDRAVRAGLADTERALNDPAFDAIRESDRFAAIEERASPAANASQGRHNAGPTVTKRNRPEVEMTDDYIRAGDVVIKGDL